MNHRCGLRHEFIFSSDRQIAQWILIHFLVLTARQITVTRIYYYFFYVLVFTKKQQHCTDMVTFFVRSFKIYLTFMARSLQVWEGTNINSYYNVGDE